MNSGEKSVAESSLLMLSAGIGAGVLVLPRAMADVGAVPMLVLLAVGCALSAFTTWILFLAVAKCRGAGLGQGFLTRADSLKFQRKPSLTQDGKWPTYADLLQSEAPALSGVLDILLVVYAEGAIMTYFLFLADFLSKLEPWRRVLGQEWQTILLMATMVFLLSLFPTVGALARLSSTGLVALICMAMGVCYRAPEHAAERAAPIAVWGDAEGLETVPAVLCVCVYAFMWHTNCVTVARELHNPTAKRCLTVAVCSTVLLYAVYAVIAFGGYWSWGDQLAQSRSIVAMYAEDDPLFVAIRVLLSVAMVITTAVNVYPLRESCAGLLKSAAGVRSGPTLHVLWAAAIAYVGAGLAIRFPHVVVIITLLGGTLTTCMMLIFPSVIAGMVLHRGAWYLTMVVNFAFAALLVGAGFGVIGRPA